MDLKQQLAKKFQLIYPNCELHAMTYYCHNGHIAASVFFKDTSGKRHIQQYDNKDQSYVSDYEDEGGNYESFNNFQVVCLFSGIRQQGDKSEWFEYNDPRLWTGFVSGNLPF